jgi:hypothetical protein
VYQVFKAPNGLTAPMTQERYDRRFKDVSYANILFYQDWAKDQPDEYLMVKLALEKLPEIQENSAKLQQKVPMPASQMNDAALNAKMLQLAKAQYPDWNVVKIIIVDAAWIPETNALGQIIRRRINTSMIHQATKSGWLMETLNFAQPYTGNGNYGETQIHAIGTDRAAVDYK